MTTVFQLVAKKNLSDYFIKQDEKVLFETERDRFIRPRFLYLKGDNAELYLADIKFGFGKILYQIKRVGTEEQIGTILFKTLFSNHVYVSINQKEYHFNGGGRRNLILHMMASGILGMFLIKKKKILYPLLINGQQVGLVRTSYLNKIFEIEDEHFQGLSEIEKQALLVGASFAGF